MPSTDPELYLADSSSLISLFNRKFNIRVLNKLVADGRLKVPNRVAAELKRQNDTLGIWIKSHGNCIIKESNENIKDFSRIARQYSDVLTETRSAADPVVVAMGLFFRDARLVVSDDAGIQLACAREGVRCLPLSAFMRATGL